MFINRVLKLLTIVAAFSLVGVTVHARPEYLKIFASDPYSRPELRSKCSVCHLNPAGGGDRNAFGQAFAASGLQITPELRRQFPDRFLPQPLQPPVSFVEGSDAEAIVELNGQRYMINTRDKTIKELPPVPGADKSVAVVEQKPAREVEQAAVYRPVDVRLINLPTAMPLPKGSLWTDFTHRFPFSDPTEAETLFGLDSFAIPSFGFAYGVTDRIQVGAYRSPTSVGRPIELYVGASFLSEQEGDPLSFMGRVGVEGRDNFQRNFTTSIEMSFARSVTRHGQIYIVPTISLGDRPLSGDPTRNLEGENAFAIGIGGAVQIRPSVSLMAEANWRVNEEARYEGVGNGIHRPAFGFGIQKASASRRHAFSLVFTNGLGTTMSQRSMTNGLLFRDDSFNGLTIGFNLSRRLF